MHLIVDSVLQLLSIKRYSFYYLHISKLGYNAYWGEKTMAVPGSCHQQTVRRPFDKGPEFYLSENFQLITW